MIAITADHRCPPLRVVNVSFLLIDDERQKQREAARNRQNNNNGGMRDSAAQPPPPAPARPTSAPLPRLPPGLPPRPNFDMFAKVTSPTSQTAPPLESSPPRPIVNGSNHSVVANRGALRMANMSAAEALKAELHGLKPLGRNAPEQPLPTPADPTISVATAVEAAVPAEPIEEPDDGMATLDTSTATPNEGSAKVTPDPVGANDNDGDEVDGDADADAEGEAPIELDASEPSDVPHGVKRKADDMDGEDMDIAGGSDSDDAPEAPAVKRTKTEEHDDIK